MTTVITLLREWSSLPAPQLEDFVGDLNAEFVSPLRHLAPIGLGLLGLPRWQGKRFVHVTADELSGVNLCRVRGQAGLLDERLEMRAVIGSSNTDSQPALIVSYAKDGPRPWLWVRDEFRVRVDGTYLGMSFLDVPGLRGLGLPFLLIKEWQ